MTDKHIVDCPSCGQKNRIDEAKKDAQPVCAKCKKPLISNGLGKPINVGDANFPAEVTAHKGLVLVDCWAPWCGPCRMLGPIIDQLAAKYLETLKVAKLNTDENQLTAAQFNIRSIPTMLLFKGGQKVDELVGAMPIEQIEARLRKFM